MTEKPLTPRQRWHRKLKQDPARYREFLNKLNQQRKYLYANDPAYRESRKAMNRDYQKRRRQKFYDKGLTSYGEERKVVLPKPKPAPKVSKFEKLTGKTLQQWADEYNVSRERIRQLYKKWGTLNDALLSGRPIDSNIKSTSKYRRWIGLTKAQLIQKYNSTDYEIKIWFDNYPNLSYEEFKAIKKG